MRAAMASRRAVVLLAVCLLTPGYDWPAPSQEPAGDKVGTTVRGAPIPPPVPEGSLAPVLNRAQDNLLALSPDGGSWNSPFYLGTHYVSQYYLVLRWLGCPPGALDEGRLRALLLAQQLADGSWYAVRDANIPHGDFNATIVNYWALKAMGLALDDAPLARARAYVLAHGGIERAATMTKIHLALFQGYPWQRLPRIPAVVFSDLSPINYQMVAQWVTPALLPIAYLRRLELSKDLGPSFRLDELWACPAPAPRTPGEFYRNLQAHKPSTRFIINNILDRQKPRGSVGGYTLTTLLAVVALTDYGERVPSESERAAVAVARGLAFVEERYVHNSSAYLGAVSDGRYWDTALALRALLGSGYPCPALQKAGRQLAASQNANGGFPVGEDFEDVPDSDTTSAVILALAPLQDFGPAIRKATHWLLSMQNRDGGWGAFSKNNRVRPLVELLARRFEDSADLFDESSPDVTGHVLEALAGQGFQRGNSAAVRRAVRYLRATQEPDTGAWTARWAVNYLNGTSAAVVGLVKAGVDPRTPWIQRAVQWLVAHQNPDGGFGETTLSYRDKRLAGVGVSTPTQTAWALLALVEAGEAHSKPAADAVQYLVQELEKYGRWIDPSAVGTGHPCIIYMDYPIYPHVFPLMALSRYATARAAGARAGCF